MAIKKILVPVTGKLDQTNTLDLAVAVGRTLHSRIDVVYMEIDPDRVRRDGIRGQDCRTDLRAPSHPPRIGEGHARCRTCRVSRLGRAQRDRTDALQGVACTE